MSTRPIIAEVSSTPTEETSSTSTQENRSIDFPNNNLIDPKSVYMNEKTADVHFEFEVNEQKILVPAHKIILVLRSPVFYAMFFGSVKETGNIKISDASVDSFKEFLALFYLDKVEINNDNVFEITNLADKYDMSQGLDMCEQILLNNTNTDKLCTHLAFAIKHKLNKLQKYCKEEIQSKAAEVFKSDDFTNVTKDVLKIILELDDFNCFETDIFDACIRWAENACKRVGIDVMDQRNLRQVLDDCFYLIPITAMNHEDFSNVLSSYTSIFSIEEVSNIMTYIAIGVSTEYTKKFACTANRARTFDWDKTILKCERGVDTTSSLICVDEYTTFSSSHKLLFGAFGLFGIQNDGSDKPLTGTISITRRGDTMLPNRLHDKIQFIHTNSNEDDTVMFKLNKPLIVKSHMKYTIHVSFAESDQLILDDENNMKEWVCSGTGYGEPFIFKSEEEDEDDIQIKFHKDPEVTDNYQEGSLISALYFNRL